MQGTSDVSKAKLTSGDGKDEIGEGYGLSDSVKKGKKKYKDVADAAQAAFESAANAAEAARAAVELSQFSPRGPDNSSNIGGEKSSNGSENKKSEQEQEGNDDVSDGEGSSQVGARSESKRSMSDSEEIIEDFPVMSFREDPVKLLEKDVVIYDSEEETQYSFETNTTAMVKDEHNHIEGAVKADTGHVNHLVHSVKDPIMRKAGLKGPISVRTRQVRGY